MYDVLIVGAGPAGLCAALVLGRCRRSVLVCGDGPHRNHAARAIHGLPGFDGAAPAEFISRAREELQRYEDVVVRGTRIEAVEPEGEGRFRFRCADGTGGVTRRVLLATGLTDEVPQIEGFADCYGISVHHCLYCDGYEHRDMPLAAYGHGEKGLGLAMMLRQWTDDVVLLSDGSIHAGHEETAGRLRALGIDWRPEPVEALDHDGGRLRQVRFATVERLPRFAVFFSTSCRQTSDLAARLGCTRDEKGSIVADPETEESSVPGVYVAGDASRDTLLSAVAVGEGARAAVAINRSLMKEDGLLG